MTESLGSSKGAPGPGPFGGPRGRSPRWLLAVGGLLAVAVVAGVVAYLVTPRPSSVISASTSVPSGTAVQKSGPGAGLPKLATGRVAPAFSLPRLGGGAPVSLGALRGHPVVLNFFASWCSDCRAELHAFAEVSNGPHGPVRFLAIDTSDHSPQKAMSLLEAAGDRYPVGEDPNATVAGSKYLVQALPVTVFISAKGHIVGQVFGAQNRTTLESWVHLLEQRAAKS